MSETPNVTSPEKKIKRTRRRLRVSCVECTRRRQKCDRQHPCGLCKARKVEHLCRWELEPFARPPPTRPHHTKSTNRGASNNAPNDNSGTSSSNDNSPSLLSPSQASSSKTPESRRDISPIAASYEMKEAAIALAQLSVAREGEYLGTGSLVCALHRLDDSFSPSIPIAKSSGLPFFTRRQYTSAISSTFTSSLQSLITGIPDKTHCDLLINDFFEHENWFYGLPKKLILCVYNGMWDTIRADLTSVHRINFHWLTLLFMLFALSPACGSEEESRRYFLQALLGKRLAEDLLSASFMSPRDSSLSSEGTAHGCIAASMISRYMCDRGQMTEAWKVIGVALRNAQNSGFHLNPLWGRWKDMDEDERVLRHLAWELCTIMDSFLSFILGRPIMIHAKDDDVPVQSKYPEKLADDGSTNTTGIYLACIRRMIRIVSEEKFKYLSIHPAPSDGGASFDARMESWETSLPSYFSCRNLEAPSDTVYPKISLQRGLLSVYYFACCMLFHRSLPCIYSEEIIDTSRLWNLEKITEAAINLLHAEQKFLANVWWLRQICHMIPFLIFDAGVTLSIALLRDAGNPKVAEWRYERDSAISMLERLEERDCGDVVRQAILVLRVLQDSKPSQGNADAGPVENLDFSGLSDLFMPTNSVSGIVVPGIDRVTPPTDAAHDSEVFDNSFERMSASLGGSVSAFDLLFSLDSSV